MESGEIAVDASLGGWENCRYLLRSFASQRPRGSQGERESRGWSSVASMGRLWVEIPPEERISFEVSATVAPIIRCSVIAYDVGLLGLSS